MERSSTKSTLNRILICTVLISSTSGCSCYETKPEPEGEGRYYIPGFEDHLIVPPGMLVDPKVRLITRALKNQYT